VCASVVQAFIWKKCNGARNRWLV